MITIDSAEALYAGDFGGLDTPDPGIMLLVKDQICQTVFASNKRMPFYNESFSFMLTEDEYMNALRGAEDPKTLLTFKIIDDNVIMRDEIIGEATVAFKDLL